MYSFPDHSSDDDDDDHDSTPTTNLLLSGKGKQNYACWECGERFPSLEKLIDHCRSHKAEVQCHLCHVTFSRVTSLAVHLENAHHDEPLHCYSCEIHFSSRWYLNKHLEEKHAGDEISKAWREPTASDHMEYEEKGNISQGNDDKERNVQTVVLETGRETVEEIIIEKDTKEVQGGNSPMMNGVNNDSQIMVMPQIDTVFSKQVAIRHTYSSKESSNVTHALQMSGGGEDCDSSSSHSLAKDPAQSDEDSEMKQEGNCEQGVSHCGPIQFFEMEVSLTEEKDEVPQEEEQAGEEATQCIDQEDHDSLPLGDAEEGLSNSDTFAVARFSSECSNDETLKFHSKCKRRGDRRKRMRGVHGMCPVSESPKIPFDPQTCIHCGRGPFRNLQTHLNHCHFCSLCGRQFKSKTMLYEHQTYTHPTAIYTCIDCLEDFPDHGTFRCHICPVKSINRVRKSSNNAFMEGTQDPNYMSVTLDPKLPGFGTAGLPANGNGSSSLSVPPICVPILHSHKNQIVNAKESTAVVSQTIPTSTSTKISTRTQMRCTQLDGKLQSQVHIRSHSPCTLGPLSDPVRGLTFVPASVSCAEPSPPRLSVPTETPMVTGTQTSLKFDFEEKKRDTFGSEIELQQNGEPCVKKGSHGSFCQGDFSDTNTPCTSLVFPGKDKHSCSCLECGERFPFLDGLIDHHCSHKGKVPCHLCQLTFSRVTSLTKHLDNAHQDEPLHCHSCKVNFSCTWDLNEHLGEKHAREENSKFGAESNVSDQKQSEKELEMSPGFDGIQKNKQKVVVGTGQQTVEEIIIKEEPNVNQEGKIPLMDVANNCPQNALSQKCTELSKQVAVDHTYCFIKGSKSTANAPCLSGDGEACKAEEAGTCMKIPAWQAEDKCTGEGETRGSPNIYASHSSSPSPVTPDPTQPDQNSEERLDGDSECDIPYCGPIQFDEMEVSVAPDEDDGSLEVLVEEEAMQGEVQEDTESFLEGDSMDNPEEDFSSLEALSATSCSSECSNDNTLNFHRKCKRRRSRRKAVRGTIDVPTVNVAQPTCQRKSNEFPKTLLDPQMCIRCGCGPYRNLQLHINRCYFCCLCGRKFKSEELLHEHQADTHPSAIYTCIDCLEDFPDQYTFKCHFCVVRSSHKSNTKERPAVVSQDFTTSTPTDVRMVTEPAPISSAAPSSSSVSPTTVAGWCKTSMGLGRQTGMHLRSEEETQDSVCSENELQEDGCRRGQESPQGSSQRPIPMECHSLQSSSDDITSSSSSSSFSSKAKHSYPCWECVERFPFLDGLIDHYCSHKGKVPCHFCQVTFSRVISLTMHLDNAHQDEPLYCHSCKVKFSCTWDLNEHLGEKHIEEKRVKSRSESTVLDHKRYDEKSEMVPLNNEIEMNVQTVMVKTEKDAMEEICVKEEPNEDQEEITSPMDVVNNGSQNLVMLQMDTILSRQVAIDHTYCLIEESKRKGKERRGALLPCESHAQHTHIPNSRCVLGGDEACKVIEDGTWTEVPVSQEGYEHSEETKSSPDIYYSDSPSSHTFTADPVQPDEDNEEKQEDNHEPEVSHCDPIDFYDEVEVSLAGDEEDEVLSEEEAMHSDNDSLPPGDSIYNPKDDLSNSDSLSTSSFSSVCSDDSSPNLQGKCKRREDRRKRVKREHAMPTVSVPELPCQKEGPEFPKIPLDPQMCIRCGRGPFRNLQMHMNRCFYCSLCSRTFNSEAALHKHQACTHPTAIYTCIDCLEDFPDQRTFKSHFCHVKSRSIGVRDSKLPQNTARKSNQSLGHASASLTNQIHGSSLYPASGSGSSGNLTPITHSYGHNVKIINTIDNPVAFQALPTVMPGHSSMPVLGTMMLSGKPTPQTATRMVLQACQGMVCPTSSPTQTGIHTNTMHMRVVPSTHAMTHAQTQAYTQMPLTRAVQPQLLIGSCRPLIITPVQSPTLVPVSTAPSSVSGSVSSFTTPTRFPTPVLVSTITSNKVQSKGQSGGNVPANVCQPATGQITSVMSDQGSVGCPVPIPASVHLLPSPCTPSPANKPSSAPGNLQIVAMFVNQSQDLALQHRLKKNWRSKAIFKCRHCGTISRQPSLRVQHRYLHLGSRQHKCYCGRTFHRQMHLLRHQVQHAEAVRFVCAPCGRTFDGAFLFARHKKGLNKRKQANKPLKRACRDPFHCDCGLMFLRPSALLWHKLRNTTPFKVKHT